MVTTRDVSQGGVKLDVPFALAAEQKVTVTLEGLRPVEGVVRWSAGTLCRHRLPARARWQELMLWLKERRKGAFQPCRRAVRAGARRAAAEPVPDDEQGVAAEPAARGCAKGRGAGRSTSPRSPPGRSHSIRSRRCGSGSLLWIVLPGLEGWPARIVSVEGYRYNCEFTQPLHPAVLERILALAKDARLAPRPLLRLLSDFRARLA